MICRKRLNVFLAQEIAYSEKGHPSTMSNLGRAPTQVQDTQPSIFNYVLGFILIGLAWGFTTPFIRRAARTHRPVTHPILETARVKNSWVRRKIYRAFFGVLDLSKNPRYTIPLLINLTGSLWFFLLIGQAELSLTVPITNSLSFFFTVLGDWYVDRKVISRDTWIGLVLSLAGIVLCVQSKNTE